MIEVVGPKKNRYIRTSRRERREKLTTIASMMYCQDDFKALLAASEKV